MNILIDEGSHPSALLVLEDGSAWAGRSCGATGEATGTMVACREMFAYQRIVEDESSRGRIIAFTYPQIGNFGVTEPAGEASAAGVVVHDMINTPSNWASIGSFPDYLAERGVVGIEDVDMRALAAHLRDAGPLAGIISTEELDAERLLARLASAKGGEANA